MEAIRRVSQTVAAPRLFVKAFSPTVAHGARLARSAALYSSEAEAAPRVALMFPGQGSQRLGMCAELAEEFSVAREVLQEVDEAVGAFVSRLMIHGPHVRLGRAAPPTRRGADTHHARWLCVARQDELVDTKNAQPAMLAHSVAAARVVEVRAPGQCSTLKPLSQSMRCCSKSAASASATPPSSACWATQWGSSLPLSLPKVCRYGTLRDCW